MRRGKRRPSRSARIRRRANRRYRFFNMIGRILFLGVLVGAAVLAMTVFFNVDTITVEGTTKYTEEEIVAGMDIKKGDNLYLWNKMKTADNLLVQFPYLKTVQIRRHLPDDLVVTVTESQPVIAVPTNGVYYLISEEGKVLEQVATDQGLTVVTGAALADVKMGVMLDGTSDTGIDALLQVLEVLQDTKMLAETDLVNIQSLMDIHISYQKRFDIQIGPLEQLEHRLRFAQTVIKERLSPSDVGTLYWDKKDRMHFVPDTAEHVAQSVAGEQKDDSAVVSPEDLAALTKPKTERQNTDGTADAAGEKNEENNEENSEQEQSAETAEQE